MKQHMLTVIGKDRPGIIARVTEFLYKKKCNLEDVNMTLLEGEFAMMVIINARSLKDVEVSKKALEPLAARWKLTAYWKPLTRKLKRGEGHAKGTESYILSAIGKDRMGIVYETSRLLASHKLNITDLNSRILGKGANSVYAMILEVDIPEKFRVSRLEGALRKLEKKLSIELRLRPVELVEI